MSLSLKSSLHWPSFLYAQLPAPVVTAPFCPPGTPLPSPWYKELQCVTKMFRCPATEERSLPEDQVLATLLLAVEGSPRGMHRSPPGRLRWSWPSTRDTCVHRSSCEPPHPIGCYVSYRSC